MDDFVIETKYPLTFRKEDSKALGAHLKRRDSVVLIGMKRVGISNFLRFFLYHKDVIPTYIDRKEKHLFIPVDLNDLVERELLPFWILTFKRLVDSVESSDLEKRVKKEIETTFLESIQGKDLFLIKDGIQKSLKKIIERGILPTLFLIRFDRLKDSLTPEFFDNLLGLYEATHHKLSFCFTLYRDLNSLRPDIFSRVELSAFSHDIYFKPAKKQDVLIITQTFKNRYKISLINKLEDSLLELVDGYIQYLSLSLIILNELGQKVSLGELVRILNKDERIRLQSEELWESLTKKEQEVLLEITQGKSISGEDRQAAAYLWNTGMVASNGRVQAIFSPLFEHYLARFRTNGKKEGVFDEFSKKEHLLFTALERKLDQVLEREEIIEAVWPEVEDLGVSDWAVDRLVARLRNKLKFSHKGFEIQTVKTRGYKLIRA